MAFTMLLTVAGCSENQENVPSESVSSNAVSEKENTNASNEFSFMNSKVTFPFKLKELKNIKNDEP